MGRGTHRREPRHPSMPIRAERRDPKADFPISFETFDRPSSFAIGGMKKAEPSCFNGVVEVRRYRVTIELVDEPREVIVERLKKIWLECSNYHHWQPLERAAVEFGVDLREFGAPGSQKNDAG